MSDLEPLIDDEAADCMSSTSPISREQTVLASQPQTIKPKLSSYGRRTMSDTGSKAHYKA